MSTPVIILNNSPETWSVVPIPPDPLLILPGWALAEAMNSATVLTGTDGCTSMMRGTRMMPHTGAMSRMEIEIEPLVERGVDRVGGADQQKGIAVRRRIHHAFGGDIAACARPVVDDNLLTEPLGEPLR